MICQHLIPGFEATTIGSKFDYTLGGERHGGIPPLPPLPQLPWEEGGIDYAMISMAIVHAARIGSVGEAA